MVSIKDIAKSVGTSASSVSFVLNGKAKQKRISDELANRITETAALMGYSPNRVAVSLRTGQSKTIGLIVENISNSFFSSLAKTIEGDLRKFGYNVVYCSTENDPATGSELIGMLYNQRVDGYLITPTHGMEPAVRDLLARNKPVVLMDRYLEDVDTPYVLVDNYSGMKEGVEYLIGKDYKHIGFVTVDLDLIQMTERTRGYMAALQDHAMISGDEQLLVLDFLAGKEASVKKITDFIGKNKRFDAIVFATNYLGIYGLESIQSLGLSIPKDIAVLCFDDHAIFNLYKPHITVVEQPVAGIAGTAVQILLGQLGLAAAVEEPHVQLDTHLVIRDSV